MKIDNEGRLVAEEGDPKIDLSKINTKKTSGVFTLHSTPDTIVIHYTAGTTARGAIGTLLDPSVKASAHIVIDNDGSITQLIPFTHIGWHAGKSSFNGRNWLNKFSIGLEIVNPGFLNKTEDGLFKTEYGVKIPSDKVALLTHRNETSPRYWQTYEEVQIEAVRKISLALKATYNISWILGHEEISPGRKTDPGPAFPLDGFRSFILDSRSEDEELIIPENGSVIVNNLNIRSSANAEAEKIALPLKKNTSVKILEEKNGWYKVKTEIEGWVASKYIKS